MPYPWEVPIDWDDAPHSTAGDKDRWGQEARFGRPDSAYVVGTLEHYGWRPETAESFESTVPVRMRDLEDRIGGYAGNHVAIQRRNSITGRQDMQPNGEFLQHEAHHIADHVSGRKLTPAQIRALAEREDYPDAATAAHRVMAKDPRLEDDSHFGTRLMQSLRHDPTLLPPEIYEQAFGHLEQRPSKMALYWYDQDRIQREHDKIPKGKVADGFTPGKGE